MLSAGARDMLASRRLAVAGILYRAEGRWKAGCLDLLNVGMAGMVSFRCLVLVEVKGKTCGFRFGGLLLCLRVGCGECCGSGEVVPATGSRGFGS